MVEASCYHTLVSVALLVLLPVWLLVFSAALYLPFTSNEAKDRFTTSSTAAFDWMQKNLQGGSFR
jgi:hypothetical protein